MRKIGRPPCSIEGCNEPNVAFTFCSTHYARYKKHGDPLIKYGPNPKIRRSPDTVNVGDRFGRWTVLGPYVRELRGKDNLAVFPCKCDCGTERTVLWRNMREYGSCGCAQIDAMIKLRKHKATPGTTEYNRARWLWQQYKMLPEEFEELMRKQNNKCAICSVDLTDKKVHVDHCHNSGNVRGLLCHQCNVGIGLLKEDANIMLKAIEYINQGD